MYSTSEVFTRHGPEHTAAAACAAGCDFFTSVRSVAATRAWHP